MAFARLYLPYSGAGSEHDYKKLHNDIVRVLTGATNFSEMELAITGGEARIVSTVPAGWELVRTQAFDTSTSFTTTSHPQVVRSNMTVIGGIASLLRAPIDGHADRYKYVSLYTWTGTTTPSPTQAISLALTAADYDDGVTPFGALTGTWSGTRRFQRMSTSGFVTMLRRNVAYYFDISVSARHIALIPIDSGYSHSAPAFYFERTRNFVEDDPALGWVPGITYRGGDFPTDSDAGCAYPIPLEDNGIGWNNIRAMFGGITVAGLQTASEPTPRSSYVKGGVRRYLFLKPTFYAGILALGDMHPDIPLYWMSKTGVTLSTFPSGSSFIVDGKEFIIHSHDYARANASYPIFVEVK